MMNWAIIYNVVVAFDFIFPSIRTNVYHILIEEMGEEPTMIVLQRMNFTCLKRKKQHMP